MGGGAVQAEDLNETNRRGGLLVVAGWLVVVAGESSREAVAGLHSSASTTFVPNFILFHSLPGRVNQS